MKKALIAAAVLAVFLFAGFVWPTQWKYQDNTVIYNPLTGPRKYLVRVNRFTGESQYLGSHGWAAMR